VHTNQRTNERERACTHGGGNSNNNTSGGVVGPVLGTSRPGKAGKRERKPGEGWQTQTQTQTKRGGVVHGNQEASEREGQQMQNNSEERRQTLYCSKKVLTSRISSLDKYQQVVLGVCRGVYGPMVNCCEDYGAFYFGSVEVI
jgi:hypothetical protein